MKIAFYNVENLFDTLDMPWVNDDDFLPGSGLGWDQKRYILKIGRLARVIRAIEEPMPVIIGLAEVENRKVLADLVTALGLTEAEAGIVHEDSPDERGIDVGFIFRKDFIAETSHSTHTVLFTDNIIDKTRDILHVQALLVNGEKLHFFVNHWPSRREGDKISHPKRMQASAVLKSQIKNIYSNEDQACIIVMGDFNCEPESQPIKNIVQDKHSSERLLVNLSNEEHRKGSGSTTYRSKWLLFDQILVSTHLLTKKIGFQITPGSFSIFKKEWMLFYNPLYGEYRPDKTYGGRKYHGGFSDHLPVYITCKFGDL